MEEDLEHFLRSRQLPKEDIMHMQRDKEVTTHSLG